MRRMKLALFSLLMRKERGQVHLNPQGSEPDPVLAKTPASMDALTDEQLKIIEDKLNNRLRKTPGFKMPSEIHFVPSSVALRS